MTSAHVLYIPIIFMLGFLVGMLASSKNKVEQKNTTARQFVSGRALVGSLLVFLFAFAGTHFFSIPRSAHAVHYALNGAEIFDKHPSYTTSEVYERISAFPPAGLELYKQFTYTTDILFPITLFTFLIVLLLFVTQRAGMPIKFQVGLTTIPITWFAMDIFENTIVYQLLDLFPERNEFLASILGYVTVSKFTLLLIAVSAPAIIKLWERSISAYYSNASVDTTQ